MWRGIFNTGNAPIIVSLPLLYPPCIHKSFFFCPPTTHGNRKKKDPSFLNQRPVLLNLYSPFGREDFRLPTKPHRTADVHPGLTELQRAAVVPARWWKESIISSVPGVGLGLCPVPHPICASVIGWAQCYQTTFSEARGKKQDKWDLRSTRAALIHSRCRGHPPWQCPALCKPHTRYVTQGICSLVSGEKTQAAMLHN